jgi:hypothetical protein
MSACGKADPHHGGKKRKVDGTGIIVTQEEAERGYY